MDFIQKYSVTQNGKTRNFISGILLSILPIFSFIYWIYIFYNYNSQNHQYKLDKYEEELFIASIDQTILTVINILLSFLAIVFLSRSFKTLNTTSKIFAGFLILLLICIGLYNGWSLM